MFARFICWLTHHEPMIDHDANGATCWRCVRCMATAPTFAQMEVTRPGR